MVPTAVVIPLLNDWHSAGLLLRELDQVLAGGNHEPVAIYLVDDGSTEECPVEAFAGPYQKLATVNLLPLKINLGHQRAIACGLVHLAEVTEGPDAVVIMDGDGEDRPSDVPLLLKRFREMKGNSIIFAQRGKRSEGPVFKIGYRIYKSLFTMMTGKVIRFGNFSVLGRKHLDRLVLAPELWLNYAATVQKRRIPFLCIHTERGHRLAGESRMNLIGLITHGLSAMATYNEVIGSRLLIGLAFVITGFMSAAAVVILIRLFTELAVPGWATYTLGLLIVLILNSLTLGLSFIFSVLGTRMASTVLPQRDAKTFLGEVQTLYSAAETPTPAQASAFPQTTPA